MLGSDERSAVSPDARLLRHRDFGIHASTAMAIFYRWGRREAVGGQRSVPMRGSFPIGPTPFGRAANRDSLVRLLPAPGEAIAWLMIMGSVLIGGLFRLFPYAVSIRRTLSSTPAPSVAKNSRIGQVLDAGSKAALLVNLREHVQTIPEIARILVEAIRPDRRQCAVDCDNLGPV